MPNTIGEAFVAVRPNTTGFEQEARTGIVGGVKRIALGLGAVFAGAKLGQFFASAVNDASDLNETISKTRVVFGKSAKQVLAFGETSATALGTSKNDSLAAAATFGNLFRALKIGQKPAADMSVRMVKLAGDLASFNNVPVDDALEAIRSGLVGETEPLRKFGVNMNDATLRTEALSEGLIDNVKTALTPAQKAQAAYGLILKQTSLAQGDFERTSGGLANQQRILSAQWDNFKAQLGTALLPLITKLVSTFNDLLPAVVGVGEAVGDFIEMVADTGPVETFIDTVGRIGTIVEDVVKHFGDVRDAGGSFMTALQGSFNFGTAQLSRLAQHVWGQISVALFGTSIRTPIRLPTGRVIGFETKETKGLVDNLWESIKNQFEQGPPQGKIQIAGGDFVFKRIETRSPFEMAVGKGVNETWAQFAQRQTNDMVKAFNDEQGSVQQIFQDVQNFGSEHHVDWGQVFSLDTLNTLGDQFNALLLKILPPVGDAGAKALSWLGQFIPTDAQVRGLMQNLSAQVARGIQGIIPGAIGAVSGLSDNIDAALGRGLSGIGGLVERVFTGAVGKIRGAIPGAVGSAGSLAAGVLGRIASGIASLPGNVAGVFARVVGNIRGAIPGAVGSAGSLAAGVLGRISSGLAAVPARVAGIFGRIGPAISGAAGAAFSAAHSLGAGILGGIVSGLGGLYDQVKSSITSQVSNAIDDAKGFFGIGSPSRVTRDLLGIPLAQGVVAGLTGLDKALAASMTTNIAGGIAATQTAALNAAAALTAAGSTGSGVNITLSPGAIVVQGSTNPAETGRAVVDAIFERAGRLSPQ